MIDGYARTIDYVRISVTDRCNLRCLYCMPKEGVASVPHEAILTYDEIVRLTRILAELGVKKVKLTGGEPLVRKGIAELVRLMKELPGIEQVTLTTNGVCLADQMDALVQAGIDGINVSLDTLDPQEFQRLTGTDRLEEVMEGLQAALSYPQIPLKINCVSMEENRSGLWKMADLARQFPLHVRYIEMMPIGLGRQFSCCREEVLLQELEAHYGNSVPSMEKLGNGPGHYYSFAGFRGKVGFISAVSHKFCTSCNRIRLTSQGCLKTCLQYDMGADLRTLLRTGASDLEIRACILQAVQEKPQGHCFTEPQTAHTDTRIMAQIGG